MAVMLAVGTAGQQHGGAVQAGLRMEGEEEQRGEQGHEDQLHQGGGQDGAVTEHRAPVGGGHLCADDDHGQGGVHAAQKVDGVAHHRRQDTVSQKEGEAHGGADDAGVENGLPQGDLSPPAHQNHALAPVVEVKDHQGDDAVDHGLISQHQLDQGQAHEAHVAVQSAEAEHLPRGGVLPPEEGAVSRQKRAYSTAVSTAARPMVPSRAGSARFAESPPACRGGPRRAADW